MGWGEEEACGGRRWGSKGGRGGVGFAPLSGSFSLRN